MAINLQHSARLFFFPCKILDLLGAVRSNHGSIKSSHMPANKVQMERKRGEEKMGTINHDGVPHHLVLPS